MTIQIPDGTQMLETGAVRLPEITSCPNTSTSRAWGATVKNDFDFITMTQAFRALVKDLLADLPSVQVTAFVLIVHHASKATFTVRCKTGLRGGPSDAAQAGGATGEATGDAGLEAFV